MADPKEKDPTDPGIAEKQTEDTKTSFERYCSENPDALECRIYED